MIELTAFYQISEVRITATYLHMSAYKAVEVSIREKSRLGNDLVEVKLVRKAFDPNKGPLTDLSEEGGEQQAKSNLFAGALGTFKNPSSHRLVKFDDAAYVAGLLSFASCLLNILDNCPTPD